MPAKESMVILSCKFIKKDTKQCLNSLHILAEAMAEPVLDESTIPR